ncbi:hypothetical protein [Streptomyces sp. C]|uniref:hypothetical protein n=1 Tax=Streptomyces sp. C TaxID=253839 RepID=UPI0001B561AD|nr:hypothetical protein [Streptomyces sp. C]EFL13229.1 conserved hypothetical protein [Streptomyces sp. C]
MRTLHRFALTAGAIGAATVLALPGNAFAVSKLSQSQAASQLRAAGVTWSSSGNCTDRQNPTCTSFEQINQASVTGLKTLKSASKCAVHVTGATEVGHDRTFKYSHEKGYKVDINPADCISNYITRSFTRIAPRKGDPRYRSSAGNVYTLERSKNHWDITFCDGVAACTAEASR